MERTFVTFESREQAFHGVQLLILSMARHAQHSLQLSVYSNAFPDWFSQWLQQIDTGLLQVQTVNYKGDLTDWNVKPHIIRSELDKGAPSVAWLDSDIMVARAYQPLFDQLDFDQLLVADQNGLPDQRRTTAIGHHPSPVPIRSINSSVLVTGQRHLPLLDEWIRILDTPVYKAVQQMPFSDRPTYLYGDQDVLEGLLSSAWAAGNGFDVDRYVDSKTEILHASNQSLPAILRWMTKRRPVFLHAQGIKPWSLSHERKRAVDVIIELSPYLMEARGYIKQIDPDGIHAWTCCSTNIGKLCRLLGANGQVMPLAIFHLLRTCIPDTYFDSR